MYNIYLPSKFLTSQQLTVVNTQATKASLEEKQYNYTHFNVSWLPHPTQEGITLVTTNNQQSTSPLKKL